VKIGIMLPQEWERGVVEPVEAYENMVRVAQEAEALGFASVCSLITRYILFLPIDREDVF